MSPNPGLDLYQTDDPDTTPIQRSVLGNELLCCREGSVDQADGKAHDRSRGRHGPFGPAQTGPWSALGWVDLRGSKLLTLTFMTVSTLTFLANRAGRYVGTCPPRSTAAQSVDARRRTPPLSRSSPGAVLASRLM